MPLLYLITVIIQKHILCQTTLIYASFSTGYRNPHPDHGLKEEVLKAAVHSDIRNRGYRQR